MGVLFPEIGTLWLALVVHPPASVLASILMIQFFVESIVFDAVYGLTVNVVVPAAAVAMAVTQRKKFR
jgi:hypothetical protein